MKTLTVPLHGKSPNLLNLQIWWVYFLSTWIYITLFFVIFMAINVYVPLRMIDLTTVDYFLKERIIDRYLSAYLLGIQFIFQGYLLSLFLLFFKDMKRWNWLLPFHSKGQILSLMVLMIILSAFLMQGVIYLFHQRIHPLLPFPMKTLNLYHVFYVVFSYLSIWALFKVKGLVSYFGLVSFALLYPVMSIEITNSIYRYLSLYSPTIQLKTSMIQWVSMSLMGLFLSRIRICKSALYQT